MDNLNCFQGVMKKELNKQLLKSLLPYGLLATRKWLVEQGISPYAIDNAIKSDVLLQLTTGVYSQYTKNLRWEGVITSLQRMYELSGSGYVGGLTALALSGLSQYISSGQSQTIHFYSTSKLPSWLSRVPLRAQFVIHDTKMLWPVHIVSEAQFLRTHEWETELPPVYFSCPEMAILEVIAAVPKEISFEHADELMQGLVSLSPRKLDVLLSACRSVKVKRIFFWLAQRQNYPWFKKLVTENYDLGAGNRVIALDGALDKKYLITVPRHMVSNNTQREI